MWQTLARIVLPISGPGLAATALLCILHSWNDFFFALIRTRKAAITATVAGGQLDELRRLGMG
ncbi:MAG: hypothetical protein ACMG6H_12890 [Acidobacteriota bacterium]